MNISQNNNGQIMESVYVCVSVGSLGLDAEFSVGGRPKTAAAALAHSFCFLHRLLHIQCQYHVGNKPGGRRAVVGEQLNIPMLENDFLPVEKLQVFDTIT